jgi:hypothetical protein
MVGWQDGGPSDKGGEGLGGGGDGGVWLLGRIRVGLVDIKDNILTRLRGWLCT